MRCKVKRGSDGIWYARPYLGRTPDGKSVRKYKQFPNAKSEEEAQALADAWAANLTVSGDMKNAVLFSLLETYTQRRLLLGASPNSGRTYRLFNKYVARYIGNANARDLTPLDFIYFEGRLLLSKEEGGQGLSQNTVRNVHDYLRAAYKFFVKAGICDTNPLIDVDKPALVKHEAKALNIGDYVKLDAQIKPMLKPEVLDKRSYRRALNAFAAWFSLVTGARVGEVCAVRRCDIDRESRKAIISGNVIEEPHKKPYRRPITKGRLARRVPIIEEQIRTIDTFIALQDAYCGNLASDAPLVTVDGTYIRPTTVSRAFSTIAKRIDIPKGFCFHDLRHTNATWQLTNGVEVQTVSKRLGHADEAITMRTYGHVMPGREEYAAAVIDDVMSAATRTRKEVCQ